MFYAPEVLTKRAELYCSRLKLKIEEQLGKGLQGMVFLLSNRSALKIHSNKDGYERERQAYGRLMQHKVTQVRGHSVPTLRTFDDKLLALEMSLVRPPFVVDFGGAYLDSPAPHATDPETKLRWMEERKSNFVDSFETVNAILADLESLYGVYLTDVHPGNIRA